MEYDLHEKSVSSISNTLVNLSYTYDVGVSYLPCLPGSK